MTSDCRIALFDGELRLTWFNGAAAKAWALSRDCLGEPADVLARDRPWPWLDALFRARTTESAQRLSGVGRIVRFEPASEPGGGVLVADLDPATFALNDAASVEAMWRRLGKMASVVAHEVKNPLAGVSGALHVIASRFAQESPERKIVEEMQARLAGLNQTIDELLLFARPVRVQSGMAPLRLVLDRAIAELRKHPDGADVQVDITGDAPRLLMDADLMCHALRNLLVNAAQASPPGHRVDLHIQSRPDRILLSVSDHGSGIDPEIAPRVFEPFFTRKSRGAGLGLTVALRIIEAHGGSVTVHGEPSGGTRVRVELPQPVQDAA